MTPGLCVSKERLFFSSPPLCPFTCGCVRPVLSPFPPAPSPSPLAQCLEKPGKVMPV